MADVIYKKGQSANLNTVEKVDGQILFTEDKGEMFVDSEFGGAINRIQVIDTQINNLRNGEKPASINQNNVTYENILNEVVSFISTYLKDTSEGQTALRVLKSGIILYNLNPTHTDIKTISTELDAATYPIEDITRVENDGAYADLANGLKQVSVPYQLASMGITQETDLTNTAFSVGSIALGMGSTAIAPFSIAFGGRAKAGNSENPLKGIGSISVGIDTETDGLFALSFGEYAESADKDLLNGLITNGIISSDITHLEFGKAIGDGAIQFGKNLTKARNAVTFGDYNTTKGKRTMILGERNFTTGKAQDSLTGGSLNINEGVNSIVIGQRNILDNNVNCAIFGSDCKVSGECSAAQGCRNTVVGNFSRADGEGTTVEAQCAYAGGFKAKATNTCARADGDQTLASGYASHAGGGGTIASGSYQTALGRYNLEDDSALFIVGNGNGDGSRKTAFSVEANGSAHLAVQGTESNSVVINSKFQFFTDENDERINSLPEGTIVFILD